MKKSLLGIFVSVGLSLSLLGREVKIYLEDDLDKDAVRHVSIILFQGKKKIDEGTSTEKGIAWFSEVKPGNYTIQAGGWGYAEKKVNIMVKDSSHTVTIPMTCTAKRIVTPFSNYNFDDGGYCFVAHRDQSDRNTLADSLGEFYIDDISVLKELAQKWKFKKPCPRFACGYHYYLQLTRNGKELAEFNINLNCFEIVIDEDVFIFTPDLMRMLWKKGKKFKHVAFTFPSLEVGRAGIDSLKGTNNLLELSNPTWMLFEGSFEFDFTFKKKPDIDSVMYAMIEKQIRDRHPGELFDLSTTGGSMHVEMIRITCNKSLFDNFTLAPITKTWKAYIPTIHYYIKQ